MPLRVIAFCLALVLTWSVVGTIELPRVGGLASSEPVLAVAQGGGSGSTDEGSVAHHHLDDLPSQVQGDTPVDAPDLLPAAGQPGLRRLPSAGPRFTPPEGQASPCLAGPLRPPRSSACLG